MPHRSMDRRSALRLGGTTAGAVGAGLLLAACGAPSDGAAPSGAGSATSTRGARDVAVQLPWEKNVQFAGEYAAARDGRYREAGLDRVAFRAGGGGTTVEEAVAAGAALIGLSSPAAIAPAVVRGAPLRIIGSVLQKNPFCLLSLEEGSPVRTVTDLPGRRIGVQPGAGRVILQGFLTANGMTASDVEIVPATTDVAPLVAGEYDAHLSFLTNEPVLAEGRGAAPVTLGFADNGLPSVAQTFTVLQATVDDRREVLKAFLRAEIQGWTAAVQDTRRAAELAVEAGTDLDATEQEQQAIAQNLLILTEDVNANGLFTMTDELIDETARSLAAMGHDVAADDLFDLSLLEEVYREDPDLIRAFTVPATGT